jgi:glucose 1-dehydrogenase
MQTEVTGANNRASERQERINYRASSGIGQAIAVRFAREGANVAISYRSGAEQVQGTQTKANAARSNGRGRELLVHADVSDEEQVKRMFATTIEKFGSQKPCPSHQSESSDFDRVLSVNLKAPFLCSREAIRHFLSRLRAAIPMNGKQV